MRDTSLVPIGGLQNNDVFWKAPHRLFLCMQRARAQHERFHAAGIELQCRMYISEEAPEHCAPVPKLVSRLPARANVRYITPC